MVATGGAGARGWRRQAEAETGGGVWATVVKVEAATGGEVWAAVVKAAVTESATSDITGSTSTIAGSGVRCGMGGGWRRGCSGGGRQRGCRQRGCRGQREQRRHGSGGGGTWRSVEARPAMWRPARPVEMRSAAWHGGRLGSVESGASRGVWRPAQQRGDAAGSGRPPSFDDRSLGRLGRFWSVQQGSVGDGRLRRGLNACETSWTIVWPSMWGACVDAGESLAVPLASSMMTTPLAPFPFLKALSWRSAICPTNLQVKTLVRLRTSGDGVTRRVLLGGVASGKFLTSMTIDGPFGSKAFFPWHSARPKPLGSASFYGGRHTLRLLLRMKSELLAVGVWRRLATMTRCSLFQRVGAGHVEEVAL
uniref:Uncharacterized protein n=1 Tax=Oryza nivara TaxID=4536 RepID=A0A0E0FQM2_ORYNI